MNAVLHWLAVHTGTVNESGPYYGFWSGFGSDLGELTLIGAVAVGVRHINCHEHRCPRFGHYKIDIGGCEYRVCHRHHPHHGSGQVADRFHDRRKADTGR